MYGFENWIWNNQRQIRRTKNAHKMYYLKAYQWWVKFNKAIIWQDLINIFGWSGLLDAIALLSGDSRYKTSRRRRIVASSSLHNQNLQIMSLRRLWAVSHVYSCRCQCSFPWPCPYPCPWPFPCPYPCPCPSVSVSVRRLSMNMFLYMFIYT